MGPGRFTLHKRQRIVKAEDYRRVFKAGNRRSNRFFTVHCHRAGMVHARLGVAVGKRYFRTAVTRNRLKRVIRESYRHHAPALPSLDIVIVARAPAAAAAARELAASLTALFKELGGGERGR